MKKKTFWGALALGAALSAPALSAGPTAEMLSYTCAGCHGTDGSSVGPTSPSIAGIDPIYFIDNMLAYKNGERTSTIMMRIAKGYTEEQIEQMADFFAAQKLVTYPQSADAGKAKKGQALHEDYCEKCHEDGGRNSQDSAVLAGQWMPYLHVAMDEFLSEGRHNPKKMKRKVDEMLKKHGEGAIDDLVNYYGSQQ
jgi:sulfide dehydrogenase cytochrome subunit